VRYRLGIVAVVLLATPASAFGGTATVPPQTCEHRSSSHFFCRATVLYSADPAVPSDLTVTGAESDPPGRHFVRFREAVEEVDAESGCTQVDAHEAVCEVPFADEITVLARGGPLADRIAVAAGTPFGFSLDGGPGDDVVSGGDGPDTLVGGPGSDVLDGGGSGDELVDGDSAPAPDVMRGGPGLDSVSYRGRRGGVTVDLSAGSGGARGEGDQLSGILSAEGGDGGDLLIGNDGRNWLVGGPGGDTLLGRGGGDRLFARRGDDVVHGGSGRDRIGGGRGRDSLYGDDGGDTIHADDGYLPDDGAADVVHCGGSRDLAAEAAALDLIEPDCERVGLFDLIEEIWPRVRLSARDPTVATLHRRECVSPRCVTTVRVVVAPGEERVRPGTVLGESTGRGRRHPPARLSPLGVQIVQRHPGLIVQIVYRSKSGASIDRGRFTTRLRLRR
jgi:hypothetical protein